MVSDQQLSDLIGFVYDAAVDSNKWPLFAEQLAGVFQSDFAAIGAIDWKREESPFSATFNLDPMSVADWVDYSMRSKDWVFSRILLEYRGKPFACRLVASEEELRSHAFFDEFLRPLGIEYFMSVLFETSPDVTVTFALNRGPERQAYTQDECDLFGELIPHLRRAYEVHDRLAKAAFAEATTRTVLDGLPAAIIVVDEGARIRFANSAARQMESNSCGLSLRHGQLWAERSEDSRALREVLRDLKASFTAELVVPGRGLSFERAGRRPLAVMVSPLANQSIALGDASWQAVVFLTDPDLRYEGTAQLLQRIYGVTTAEGEILDELIAGRTLKEIALGRDVSEGTVRTQLKSIFAKTRTTGQSELVALVVQHPAWQRHHAASELFDGGLTRLP